MLIKKYTEGYVVQIFDLEKSEWVSQRFIASGDSETSFMKFDDDQIEERIRLQDIVPKPEPYLPFDMVQP